MKIYLVLGKRAFFKTMKHVFWIVEYDCNGPELGEENSSLVVCPFVPKSSPVDY